MRIKQTFSLLILFGITFVFTACELFGTIIGTVGLRYSIQVDNQSSLSRSINGINDESLIELYITRFEYNEDQPGRTDWIRHLIIIANGDREGGGIFSDIINNAGWYSTTANLNVVNDYKYASYSTFSIIASKLRVDGTEYDFPIRHGSMDGQVVFGRGDYINNFSRITINSKTTSLKTVLTVLPGILGTPNSTGYDSQGLATDPYKFIMVEGRINE